MTEKRGNGSRSVDLLIPFEVAGERVETIEFRPFLYEDYVRLMEGHYGGVNDLLCDVAGRTMTIIGQLRYPDADTVLEEFMAHVPPMVRTLIAEGNFPRSNSPPADEAPGVHEWPADAAPSDLGPLDEPQDFSGPGMDLIDDGNQ